MILPKEVLKKVKLLEINTRKLVNNQLAGEYHTAFKGQGMSFSDFREYVPGDDVRNISWSLMAKTNKVFIKQFEEERELVLILMVDISGSTDFGSGKYFKGEVLAHLSALLAFSAVKNNDRVGLVLFSDQIEHYVPPKKGRGQVLRILRDLYYLKPKSPRTNLSQAFEFLLGAQKKRATIFVMSDFQDQNFEQQLRQLGRRHDVVACIVEDPFEVAPVSMGVLDIQDPETGEIITVDTSSRVFKDWYQNSRQQTLKQRNDLLKRSQVDQVLIQSNADFADPLIQFMKCELLPNSQSLGVLKITVGEVLLYRCVGSTAAEIPSDFVYEKAQLKVIPEDKYKIQLLKAEKKSDQEMQLDLTSYQVGHNECKEITLTDGEHLIPLEPIALTVESVMTEMKPPPQEPFGPMGPMRIEFPYLFLYIMLVILGLFVMGLGISLWKRMKWRKVLEGLKEHDAAQTPANQFYQNLRKLQRANLEKSQVAIQELYSFWKLFLLRKYRIPAYDWNSKSILKYIKSKDRILYKKLENDLWQIFHEFDRALKDIDQTSKKDLSLLMDHSRHLVDQMQTRNEGRS